MVFSPRKISRMSGEIITVGLRFHLNGQKVGLGLMATSRRHMRSSNVRELTGYYIYNSHLSTCNAMNAIGLFDFEERTSSQDPFCGVGVKNCVDPSSLVHTRGPSVLCAVS